MNVLHIWNVLPAHPRSKNRLPILRSPTRTTNTFSPFSPKTALRVWSSPRNAKTAPKYGCNCAWIGPLEAPNAARWRGKRASAVRATDGATGGDATVVPPGVEEVQGWRVPLAEKRRMPLASVPNEERLISQCLMKF